jgi:hypothetical protein
LIPTDTKSGASYLFAYAAHQMSANVEII